MAVREARLAPTEHGLVPQGEGWYVLDAREARWWHSEAFGRACTFEGDVRFGEYGINVHVLLPGQPNCMYHAEDAQEDFLVLSGECILLVEGEERRLKAWDFVHCPPMTEHVIVGAGEGPCAVVMAGTRKGPDAALRYPVVEVARALEAGVERETASAPEAYARFPSPVEAPYRAGDLPSRP
jgi:uncharacterized cupin superfamily protein